MRKAIVDLLAKIQWYILILLFLLSISVWSLNWLSSPVSDDNTPKLVTIPRGASGRQIAHILDDEGLIRSSFAFEHTVRIRREGEQLKPGQYELRRNMNLLQIINKLVKGEVAASWITIPEGRTVNQIARILAENGIADEQAFAELATTGAEGYRRIVPVPSTSLEGYLFPNTYLFPKAAGCDIVIREMLGLFRKQVYMPYLEEIRQLSLPTVTPGEPSASFAKFHQVITLASLIEREAKTDGDRLLISSVLHNRLRRGMPLQVDATVQYALGEHRSRLFYRDYETPSEYNTYLRNGLPPGPIANPGLKSIEAALRPADTYYLFYVAVDSGDHVFSETLDEHNRAVAAARRARKEAAK